MSENNLIQNEAVPVESASGRAEWSAPQVEALSVVDQTLFATNPGDDGSGFFTGS
jgi:hypothetical protein